MPDQSATGACAVYYFVSDELKETEPPRSFILVNGIKVPRHDISRPDPRLRESRTTDRCVFAAGHAESDLEDESDVDDEEDMEEEDASGSESDTHPTTIACDEEEEEGDEESDSGEDVGVEGRPVEEDLAPVI